MTQMHNPAHPGEILKEDVLPGLNMTVTAAAKELKVARVTLSRVLNGKAALSADMALRVGKWLNTSPQSWMNMQTAYDLWQASKKRQPRIRPAKRLDEQPA